MKLAVVGSRDFDNYELMKKEILAWVSLDDIELIVSGGARGADQLAEKFASEHGVPTLIFKPDWRTYGKRAGYLRNDSIVNSADAVIAFWDGVSRGTSHSIDLANSRYQKPVKVVVD